MSGMQQQQPAQAHEPDPSDSQSSVQQIIQKMMMSSPLNGSSSIGNEMKGMNGIAPTMNGGGMANSPSIGGGMGFGNMGGVGPFATVSGLRAAMVNSAMGMNGRVGMNHMSQDVMGMNHHQQQQDMGNRVMGGLGPVNNFNNLHFDWKPAP